ncbi:hypothetical protein MMC30_009390 [Trapelia coarctata]|nr:hypothetical protein [Trapelia coarctata]
MKAIVIQGPGDAQLVGDCPVPKLRDGYLKVKTVAVALNPTDWKHIDYLASKEAIVGCDYSGIVEEVGNGVTKDFKKGDKICGFVHGADAVQHENGAFAEHIVAKAALQLPIPKGLSFEEAATLGVGVTTVGQGLYQSLKLPLPTEPSKDGTPVLIYGGSTATGTLAIQLAKQSGLTVVTTASPRNHPLCKELGADAVFDYNDPTCAEQISDYTKNKLHHAFDTISNEQTAAICAAALSSSSSGSKIYSNLMPIDKLPRDDVQNNCTLAYSSLGEDFKIGEKGQEMPGKNEDLEFASKFWSIAEELLSEGKVKPHPVDLRPGGLKGVLEGLDEMRKGKVSGKKLVYRIEETP